MGPAAKIEASQGDGVLEPFFRPRSVAIIGLSRSAIGSPVSVLTTLKDFGYAGRTYVVNPRLAPADGLNVCPTLSDLPETVDLAIVSVERSRVAGVLRDCVDCGIGSAIVITQGFADADDEGRRLQDDIVRLAKDTGLRILGPNTIGLVNSVDRFTSSFIEIQADRTPVGQVSQSGLFMMGHHLINNEPAGFCLSIDLGNCCDIGLVDVLEFYEQEDNVRVIECHTEGITDGLSFLDAAARISRTKPIIALKAGTSEAGQKAVASHTGAVAGSKEVYRAAFRKAGVIPARDAEELRLLSKAFVTYPPPSGRRVAIMSFSGGGAILAIDAIESAGLALAELSESTKAGLADLFPDWMEIDNPVDVWMPVSRDFDAAFPRILECILADESVDSVICIYCSYTLPKYALYDSSAHIRAATARHPDKPVLCWSYGLDIEGFTKEVEKDGTAMVFPSLADAADTLAKLTDYGARRDRTPEPASAAAPTEGESEARSILDRAALAGARHLFTEGLEIFAAYGLAPAPWRLVTDADELAKAARDLSYPLCLKVVSPDILHKSDSGGIRLGIGNAAGLAESYRALIADVRSRMPGANIAGILVQEMAPAGKEVMIGMKRDAEFGPCVVFGTGGVYAEIIDDFAFRIAPVSAAEARDMIDETKISEILKGARGETPCDLAKIVDVLVGVSRMAGAHPQIKEIDINPLIVNAEKAVVVDARIIL